ncbi:unnamed protein product, partial [Hapterophycus canaliculatus]
AAPLSNTPYQEPHHIKQSPVSSHKMASRASLEYDYLFKIVLVGDAAVGKTNLLACYT